MSVPIPNRPCNYQDSQKLVPVEVWEDEPYERTEIQKVIEDKKVPQVGLDRLIDRQTDRQTDRQIDR